MEGNSQSEDPYSLYGNKRIEQYEREKALYAEKYTKEMVIWGVLNLVGIIIGVLGYLYYEPLHFQIEPDDFFGAIGYVFAGSFMVQGLVGAFTHPFWLC